MMNHWKVGAWLSIMENIPTGIGIPTRKAHEHAHVARRRNVWSGDYSATKVATRATMVAWWSLLSVHTHHPIYLSVNCWRLSLCLLWVHLQPNFSFDFSCRIELQIQVNVFPLVMFFLSSFFLSSFFCWNAKAGPGYYGATASDYGKCTYWYT